MRNPRVLLYVALVLALLNLIHKAEPQQTLPLIHADYQRCLTFHENLEHKPAHNYDYRLGDKRVDRGIS